MTTITTLEVTFQGKTHTLAGDDEALFSGHLHRAQPFNFTFPGDAEATRIVLNGLRIRKRTVVIDE